MALAICFIAPPWFDSTLHTLVRYCFSSREASNRSSISTITLLALSPLATPTTVTTYPLVCVVIKSLACNAFVTLLMFAEMALESLAEYFCNISFGVAIQFEWNYNLLLMHIYWPGPGLSSTSPDKRRRRKERFIILAIDDDSHFTGEDLREGKELQYLLS